MIIYMDRVPTYQFPVKQKFKNMIWPRLIGINVSPGPNPEIVPVYIPFARFEPGDGQLVIELAMWTEDAWVILLHNKWPFIYVARGGGVNLVDRSVEDESDL